MIRAMILAAALGATGCTAASTPPAQTAQTPQRMPACQSGADVKGIAAGFFAFFQDRPECF